MTFLDAAYEVLRQVGQPLHYTDIAAHALAAGLLDTRDQTPDAKSERLRVGGPGVANPRRAEGLPP